MGVAKRLTKEQKLRLALRALKLANETMSYCQGDSWEQEGTRGARNAFNDLFERITGKPGEA